MRRKSILITLILLFALILLAGCKSETPIETDATPCPTAEKCPDCPTCPDCPECPSPAVKDVPFQQMWLGSGHADSEAEAFRHWDEDDPPEVSTSCAKCHSTPGFLDFLGADGTEAGVVDNASAIGSTVECVACHNDATQSLTSVTFPSGIEVTGLGAEARCLQCHQGRASSVSVDSKIEELGIADDLDTVTEDLGFINIHYYAAGATMYGTVTKGGYEYEGKQYDSKFDHVAGYDTCLGCHNSHTLELKVEECSVCHQGVTSSEDLREIRMEGSDVDYDGDGDVEESIAAEIEGLQVILYQAIQSYSSEFTDFAIVYDSHSYPYFFADTNSDGVYSEGDERYSAWTGRLLKAAFNYQTTLKDPGGFAHGGKYMIQLLYDSIEDLNTVISTPMDLSSAHRIDSGHFAGSEEAFRHWDDDGEVSSGCAMCHSAEGLPFLFENNVVIAMPLANGLNCATCHDDLTTYTRFVVEGVEFTSGKTVDTGDPDSNLCLNCHQGRQAKATVDSHIARADVGDDEVSEDLSFRNPHYFAAGATFFGADAEGPYQYEGKEYSGKNTHIEMFDTCIECHDTHGLEPKVEACATCHGASSSVEDIKSYRFTKGDFDGDGDETEGLAYEIEGMHEALYQAILDYTKEHDLADLVYFPGSYPYVFIDTNGDGVPDPEETVRANSYSSWTPSLIRAAFNYQWVAKDPGAFAHNGKYIIEILYDSIEALGGDVSGMLRSPVAE